MANYLIGIGGTGARVIESAIFLSFAGLGPDHLNIIIIDPDEANGNLTRTKTLIQLYKTCKEYFRDLPDDNFLLKTKISTPENYVWSVFERHNVKLSDYIYFSILQSTNKTLADFATVLFTEEELNTPLNEGFRGHPSIGAVVISEIPKNKDPWLSFFREIKEKTKNPYEAKVMLVGSLFGGTGASGLPTLSKVLKESEEALIDNNKNKILLGGIFVLPYFNFEFKEEDLLKQQIKMFVTSDNFYIATKAALRYYDTKELPFDEIYLIGDDSPRSVGKFSPGSKTQENMPDFIELISTLAAFDFFSQPSPQNIERTKFFYSRYESDTVKWHEIPTTRNINLKDEKTQEFKSKLTITTLFSYILSTYGYNTLGKTKVDYTWYLDNFKKDSPSSTGNIEKIKSLIELSKQFLWWLSSISKSRFSLFDISQFAKDEPKLNVPITLIDPEENPSNITSILKNAEDRKNENLKFDNFVKIMNKMKVKKELTTSSKFIDLFFKSAQRFSQDAYNINI